MQVIVAFTVTFIAVAGFCAAQQTPIGVPVPPLGAGPLSSILPSSTKFGFPFSPEVCPTPGALPFFPMAVC